MGRANNRPWKAWYKTAKWERKRQDLFAEQPLCVMCLQSEIITPANTADHIIPHRGCPNLFWNGALQPLCSSCHSRDKQREEAGQDVIRFDANGWPQG